MDSYLKLPKKVFDLNLTPNEFIVLVNLLKVLDYREYKGEVNEGWFAKSKNELVKECGLGSHNRLNRILQDMSKMDIVQIKPTKVVTYFKLNMSKMDIVQNGHMSKMNIDTMSKIDIPDMSKMDTVGMSKMDNLHNNKQELEKDQKKDQIINQYNIDQIKEINKQNLVNKEKEEIKKINVDKEDTTPVTINGVESIPVFPENFKNEKMDKLLENFKSSEDNTKHPTKEQLLCMAYIEKLAFNKKDFKLILEKPNYNGYYIPSGKFELMCCTLQKLKPIAEKYNFKTSGIPDCTVYQEMICKYLEKNLDYFKIKAPR